MEAKVTTWIIVLFAGILLGVLFAHAPLLRGIGTFLVSGGDGDVGPADAIIPLGSVRPDRAIGAAALFHKGLAPRVLVPKPVTSAHPNRMQAVGPWVSRRQAMAAQVLERLDVPDTAITLLSEGAATTQEELETVGRYARRAGYHRLILVTSRYHTRRVRIIWNIAFAGDPAAIVYALPSQNVAEENALENGWWRSRSGRQVVAHEYLGITWFLVRCPLAFLRSTSRQVDR